MSKRNEITTAVLARLKASHPSLTDGQRVKIAGKFADEFATKFPDAVPGADELDMHLAGWPQAHPAMFRPVPSVEAVLKHMARATDNPVQTLQLAHEVAAMSEDARLAAVPFVKESDKPVPDQERLAARAPKQKSIRDLCLERAENFDSLSAQQRRAITLEVSAAAPQARGTAQAVKAASREPTPAEKLAIARGL